MPTRKLSIRNFHGREMYVVRETMNTGCCGWVWFDRFTFTTIEPAYDVLVSGTTNLSRSVAVGIGLEHPYTHIKADPTFEDFMQQA